jgi:transcriptional regulator with XRE-family HTH domain
MNQTVVNHISPLTEQECALQIGKRFAIARQSLGMSTQKMADFLGTKKFKIIWVENGECPIPTSWAEKLDRFLDVNLTWLTTGAEHITKTKTLAFKELCYLMQVPIIEENVLKELEKLKTIFSEQINEFERVHDVSLCGGLK